MSEQTTGLSAQEYARVQAALPEGEQPVLVCLEADMAKALGHKLCLLSPEKPCLCIDSIHLTGESFLDIGQPVGPCLPVVIKTLVLSSAPAQQI